MLLQNPIGIALAALLSLPRLRGRAFYRTVFFLPTMLSFVIVGFTWKLILSAALGRHASAARRHRPEELVRIPGSARNLPR